MRLRHPKPVLTHSHASDTAKPPFASRVTRWLYFTLLIVLLGYIIWYAMFRYFYIDNRGLVNVDRVRIASSRGGRILELPVKNGDHVKKGDLLVRLKSLNECVDLTGKPAESAELRNLRQKLASDQVRLKNLYALRRTTKAEIEQMKFRHAMELSMREGSGTRELENELQRMNGDIRHLRSMIALRKKEIQHLKDLLGVSEVRPECHDELIYAPFDATVVSEDHLQFEVMQRTQPIMDIVADDAEVHIESYFKNDNFNSLQVGMQLTVFLPDGSESKGRIVSLQSTALALPSRGYHDNYIPYRTRVLAILAPMSKADAALWRQFNQMEVEVRGWR